MTYAEYRQKYYGDDRMHRTARGDTSDVDDDEEDVAYLSDGCVDYTPSHR